MYYLGIDVGTTATKVLAVDRRGRLGGRGTASYRLITNGVCIEQNPQDFIEAICTAVRQTLQSVRPAQIEAISLSTQGATTAPCDGDGKPRGNAYTWMDGRSTQEAENLANALGAEYFYRKTGWPLSASLDAAKILHMRRRFSGEKDAKYLSTLEICNRYLTGRIAIDPTNAQIRNLYSLADGRWDEPILAAIGIDDRSLADVLPAGALVGRISGNAAKGTGLLAGTPVYNGAHDQYCASIGSGATRAGDLLVGSGTTWALMGVSDRHVFSRSRIATGRHLMQGLYGNMISLIGSGSSYQWFRNRFGEEDFPALNRRIEDLEGQNDELLYYPYMYGISYPDWTHGQAGVFAGIRPEYGKYHFARAILEAAVFRTRDAMQDLIRHGCAVRRILFTGGAARSELWTQMLTNGVGDEVFCVKESDACAVGAAMIAAVGSGGMPDYETCARAFLEPPRVYAPQLEASARLAEKYRKWKAFCEAMRTYYQGIVSDTASGAGE